MSYKNREIWRIADEHIDKIYEMTVNSIPGFEKDQSGNQIRRSVFSVKAIIVYAFIHGKH